MVVGGLRNIDVGSSADSLSCSSSWGGLLLSPAVCTQMGPAGHMPFVCHVWSLPNERALRTPFRGDPPLYLGGGGVGGRSWGAGEEVEWANGGVLPHHVSLPPSASLVGSLLVPNWALNPLEKPDTWDKSIPQ